MCTFMDSQLYKGVFFQLQISQQIICHKMVHSKIYEVIAAFFITLRPIWRVCVYLLLWTPANIHLKFTSRDSQWIYFQFQSKLVHSLVTLMTAISVPSHILLIGLAFWVETDSNVLKVMGFAFALWNLILSGCHSLPKKFLPKKNYKLSYLFLFLSYFGSSIVVFSTWISQNRHFLQSQISGVFLYIFIFVTFYFQWSTLLTVLLTVFYLVSFLHPFTTFLIEEVSDQ